MMQTTSKRLNGLVISLLGALVLVLSIVALVLGTPSAQAYEQHYDPEYEDYYPSFEEEFNYGVSYSPSSAALPALSNQQVASTAQEAAENHVHVVDNADIISDSVETQLSQTIKSMILTYGVDVVIYTDTSVYGCPSLGLFAADFYDENGYGIGPSASGMVMFICMESGNRGWYTAATGTCQQYVTSETVNYVDDAIEPLMKELDFDSALTLYLEKWEKIFANGGSVPFEGGDWARIIIYALIFGAIIGFINLRSKKKKMKTVAVAERATGYMVANSLELRKKEDQFAGVTVSRIPKPKQNNHGGGSSGFGGFSSSGGRSFSGGGRSF